jgi:hypothetical protein
MNMKPSEVAPKNPMTSTKIEISPLFRNIPDVFEEDLRGDKRENEIHIARIRQAAEGREVAEERERIDAARQKLETGYYRRTPGGGRVYITPFGAVPANEEEK